MKTNLELWSFYRELEHIPVYSEMEQDSKVSQCVRIQVSRLDSLSKTYSRQATKSYRSKNLISKYNTMASAQSLFTPRTNQFGAYTSQASV